MTKDELIQLVEEEVKISDALRLDFISKLKDGDWRIRVLHHIIHWGTSQKRTGRELREIKEVLDEMIEVWEHDIRTDSI